MDGKSAMRVGGILSMTTKKSPVSSKNKPSEKTTAVSKPAKRPAAATRRASAKPSPAEKPAVSKPATESYVLKSQVHFGSLKTSVPKGTLIVVDRTAGKAVIGGAEHDNIAEIDMMIRAGFIVPGKTESVSEPRTRRAGNSPEKLEVVQSDQDLMEDDIDISSTKKSVREANRKAARGPSIEVIHEESGKDARGLSVVSSDKKMAVRKADTDEEILSVVNGDNDVVGKVPSPTRPKGVPAASLSMPDSSDDASLVNGEQQGSVVKSIAKGAKAETRAVSSGAKLSAKHGGRTADSDARAKAAAEARKAAIAAKKSEHK